MTRSDDREGARLAALRSYDILDTPRERDFDDVAELASEICGTPIGVVNLIAEGRQFFKAEVGLGVRETPLDSSFCARAILEEEFLMIPDATRDARFANSPLVAGAPHLRFYAGALLKTDDGHAIGTVCVLDYMPRELSPTQKKALRVLARQVMTNLELRRVAREQTLAQEAGRIGTFELDVKSDRMLVSAEFCRLYGLRPSLVYPASAFEALVASEDAAIRSDRTRREAGSAALDVEYRVRRANDGRLRWLARRATFLRDTDGTVTRMVGTVHDVTERRQLQEYQAALLELGDALRTIRSSGDALGAAARIVGRILHPARAGYARADAKAGTFEIEHDWTEAGLASLSGRYGTATFPATIDRLARGAAVIVADVEATDWLSSDVAGYRAIGTRAIIKVPLLENGVLAGVFYVLDSQPRAWSDAETDFVHGVADRLYAALSTLKAEAQQVVLNEELSHRLKNTLAMVQAIADQTLRSVPDRAPVKTLEKRIFALSSAHDVLLQGSWTGAPLRQVVATVLATFDDGARVVIDGPDTHLGPRSTLSASLLFHELGTNAVKYGALSQQAGRVVVTWAIEGADLVMEWREEGGPAITRPTGRGFGSRLIGLGLGGTGDAIVNYEAGGLVATFRAPTAELSQ